jgi:hypothetical protein
VNVPVNVVPPRPIDHDLLGQMLGEPPLRVEHVDSPSILVDGRYHTAASHWLRRKHQRRPVMDTTVAHARRLAAWIEYLRVVRHRIDPAEHRSDVFAADEEDLLTYYRARQYDQDTQVSSSTWQAQRSTLKQFHEFLRRSYNVPLPFDLERINLPDGRNVQAIAGLRPRRRTGSRGTPITPGFADLLVQGAMRIDQDGRQHEVRTVDRDAALVSLGLAAGLRRETLTYISRYEIPALSSNDFTTIRVPDFITKNDAGGDAFVFSHRLTPVHHYLTGHRAELVEDGRLYRPTEPLQLTSADDDIWTAIVDGKTVRRRWVETDAATRLRLVDLDGRSSPLAWLDPRTGDPVGYDTCGRITARARDWTREYLNPKFPASFRTHDLRHSYATHLTVCIFKQALAEFVVPSMVDAYPPHRVGDAVEVAKMSLGHASDDSTKLYTRNAHKFLNIPLDEFLGRR